MFYFFSKVLSYFITPAGWLVALLVLALFTRSHRRRRWLAGGALAVFWLFGNTFLVNEFARWWEYGPVAVPADTTTRIAVVLTGGMMDGMTPIPDRRFLLDREADRAGQALYLYKQGAVRTILISGGNGDLPFQPGIVSDEGQMTARFLETAGVRREDIILENKSKNTRENALFTARLLRKQFGTNRCVLVTSAWHMRRTVGCFRKAGVEVVPFPGSFMSHQRTFVPGEWLLPNAQAFQDAYYLVKEGVGYMAYRLVGYI
ncbi:YdcF family protein [Spirosoma sordidisoli]|uniref:YdcF family protein n=1 Tax=Spirosoma sordidisoli TaxID=2502893 RepID=A0A4Q2UQC5_9BACT|nr:YdcF family protein [Spirosoma sordidisoli]RYC71953.1 YdcF family protein [Spirosoma sordidisoli]